MGFLFLKEKFYITTIKRKKERIKNMNIENSYKVGDKVFNNLKDAQRYVLETMYNNGLDWILENATSFSDTLLKFKEIKPVRKASENGASKTYSNIGKGNLEMLAKSFETKYKLFRDKKEWPIYHFRGIGENNSFSIRFTGKVFELYDLLILNLENVDAILEKYKINIEMP